MTVPTHYEIDDEDADVILLTADPIEGTIEFHVHKCILAVASPFFNDMFSLPQDLDIETPPSFGKQPTVVMPVIPVPEPAHVLDTLLHFVYPVPDPDVNSLDELTILLGVAIKYDFIAVIDALRGLLVSPSFVTTDPIRVYAIACRFDLDEEAKIASAWTLGVNLLGCEGDSSSPSYDSDSGIEVDSLPHTSLKYISAYDYHLLLTLHRRRAKAACALLQIPDDIKCTECNGSVLTMHAPPRWWQEWVKRSKEELWKRPSTDRIFEVDWVFNAATSGGCSRCPESVVVAWKWLGSLKEAIDSLPRTI